jgi:hypothetical protein
MMLYRNITTRVIWVSKNRILFHLIIIFNLKGLAYYCYKYYVATSVLISIFGLTGKVGGGIPVWNVVRYEQPNRKESKCRHTVDTAVTPMPMVRGYIAC